MKPSSLIRRATLGDLETIRPLAIECANELGEDPVQIEADLEAAIQSTTFNGKPESWVAFDGDSKPAGFAIRAAAPINDKFYIDPLHRGEGLGTGLVMQRIQDEARSGMPFGIIAARNCAVQLNHIFRKVGLKPRSTDKADHGYREWVLTPDI